MENVLAILLAGGAGERLNPLTRDTAKPAVSFGGMYRIIDFTLSNCINSDIRRIFILTQYKALELVRHLRSAWYFLPSEMGEFVEVIPPMKRVSFRSQVVAPRAAVQEYELAGRKSFVPVIAFNALYEWSGGNAQSSAAYLVGRDTQRDKLGPLRLDQGAREFSALGARPLPSAVRT